MGTTHAITMEQLPEAIRRAAEEVPERVLDALRASARQAEGLAVDKSPADTGIFRDAWSVEDVENGAILLNDSPHAMIVEEGSRPHWPPMLPILEYMGRRSQISTLGVGKSAKYNLSDQEIFKGDPALEALRQAAFSVCAKIAAHGTKPQRVLAALQGEFGEIVADEIKRVLEGLE